jgi:serine/threonine protein kinase
MVLSYLILAACLLFLLFLSVSLASATTGIHFSCNSTSGWANINTGGATTLNGGILELTSASPSSSCSWATYGTSIALVDNDTGEPANFLTHFSFIINATSNNTGDGFTFFLSSYPAFESTNFCGGNLGLPITDDNTDSSQNQVVAVEFDTYINLWDPQYKHVGIDVNNIYSVVVHRLNEIITNGTLATASISYSAANQTLNVSLNYQQDSLPDVHKPILSYKVNLTQVLPKTVTVGFSAATGTASEIHQILSWEFSTTFGSESSTSAPLIKAKYRPSVLVVVLCGIGIVLFLGGFGWFLLWRKKSRRRRGYNCELPKKYSHKELAAATSNFASKNKLGEGGFGPVFKGYMWDSCDEVAVKHLKQGSAQGSKEFKSEVEILSKLTHRNLVELFGWCEESDQLLLVYKYMSNGNLSSLLFDRHRLLLWHKRYEIVLNLVDALCYLHSENGHNKSVVHRDIKPGNVLLDSNLEAKLSDFGLARCVDDGLSANTTNAAGSWGYVAPELFNNDGRSKPSTQSDMYSFGVVLLEITSGRRPVDLDLVQFVWAHYGRNELLKAVDERLRGDFNASEIERVMIVGLWCAHPIASERPTIELARKALMFDDCELPVLPESKPLYPPFLSGQAVAGRLAASELSDNSTKTGTSVCSSQDTVRVA